MQNQSRELGHLGILLSKAAKIYIYLFSKLRDSNKLKARALTGCVDKDKTYEENTRNFSNLIRNLT